MKTLKKHIAYEEKDAENTFQRKLETASSFKLEFEKIFFEYERLVRGIILRMGLVNEADELTQEIFVKIWKGLENFDGRSSLKTWIYRIAHNAIHDHLRKKKRNIIFSFFGEGNRTPEKITDDGRAEKEQSEWLREAMNQLKPELRMVLTLSYMEDLSINEIAQITGKPEGTVKSRIFHAKKMMKGILVKKGFGDFNGK